MERVHGLSPEQQVEYETLRKRGVSHNMAEIIASGRPPGGNFRDERWRLTDEKAYWKADVPQGKYQAGLARYPGDKRAFVQSHSEAKRLADSMGRTIHDKPINHDNPGQKRAVAKENAW